MRQAVFSSPTVGSQLKLAFFMSSLQFIDSPPTTLTFVSWDDLHAYSWFFMCFWGNTSSAEKSSMELKDE